MSSYRFAVRRPGNYHAPRAARSLPEDWDLVCTARVNVFLMGGEEQTRILADTLAPCCKKPVVTIPAGERLALPSTEQVGTLILYQVSELAPADQHRLVQWLEGNRGNAQVISTSGTSIVSKIAAGSFLEPLYYRLNTLYIEVASLEQFLEMPLSSTLPG